MYEVFLVLLWVVGCVVVEQGALLSALDSRPSLPIPASVVSLLLLLELVLVGVASEV